jgi:hypothetical protein
MKFRPASQLERENNALKNTIIVLRREVGSKAGVNTRLKMLLAERLTRIDDLQGKIDQLRAANLRLGLKCAQLSETVKPLP